MSQAVREIAEGAAHWIASHYRDGIEHEIGKGNLPFAEAVIRGELESRFAGHVLASTEPVGEAATTDNGKAEWLSDNFGGGCWEMWIEAAQIYDTIANLRAQLQVATMRAEAAEGDTRMMDELQAKCGALMGDLKAAQQRIENQRTELRQKNAEVALGIAQSESYLRIIKSAQQLADERGREVERLREAFEALGRRGCHEVANSGNLCSDASMFLYSDWCDGCIINAALATPAATPPADKEKE